jgi:hypothetical protein
VVLCLFAKGREEARERDRHYLAMVETHLRPAFSLSSFGPKRLAAGLVASRAPRTAPVSPAATQVSQEEAHLQVVPVSSTRDR